MRHVIGGLDLTGVLPQSLLDCGNGGVDAPLESNRASTRGDRPETLVHQRLGEHRSGGRPVTRDIVGLGGHLLGQLRPEVLVRVVELDLTGHGHAVIGNGRSAPLLVDDNVTALGAEGDLHSVGEGVDTALKRLACLLVEQKDLCHRCDPLTW